MATPIYVGIDPGFTGYITVLDFQGNYLAHFKTPTNVETKQIKKRTGARAGKVVTKTKTELDEAGILAFLRKLTSGPTVFDTQHAFIPYSDVRPYICVEKQHAMTGQGLASTAKNMYGYGFWVGICKGLGYETYPVGAVEWQKITSDPKALDKKAASVASVQKWNPTLDLRKTPRSRILDHNLADSACIARYAHWRFGSDGDATRTKDM